MKNQKTMGNKGFSLVELIVVIAIMVVLVAVLAPVFTKYVEESRRATDVQNANSIAEAVVTDAIDGVTTFDSDSYIELTEANKPSAIASVPAVKGTLFSDAKFYVKYTKSTNVADVIIGSSATSATNTLVVEENAKTYKKAKDIAALNNTSNNSGGNNTQNGQ